MFLLLKRHKSLETCTHGDLFVNCDPFCVTLEDIVRDGEKVYGKTAIPAGTYDVIVSYSQHFKKPLPILLAVPKFSGVRIHSGNSSKDTEGCILVASERTDPSKDWVSGSRKAFDKLFDKIMSALNSGQRIVIEIKDFENGEETEK